MSVELKEYVGYEAQILADEQEELEEDLKDTKEQDDKK